MNLKRLFFVLGVFFCSMLSAETFVELHTTLGVIRIKMLDRIAPNTVQNFVKLAQQKFYDGTAFHRVVPDFVIQGGDPISRKNPELAGSGGPGYTIKGEFSRLRSHRRGMVSMARGQDPDSAGSQFFICVKDAEFLDGQYALFGEVVDGLYAVDAIAQVPLKENRWGHPCLPQEAVRITHVSVESTGA